MTLISMEGSERSGLIDMTAACTAVNTRPRNLPQFQEAARAAEGDEVEEIDACQAFENMTLWSPRSKSWITVKSVTNTGASHGIDGLVPAKTTIYIHNPAPETKRWWMVNPDRPVVRRLRGSAQQTPPARGITGLVLPGFP